ncbi:uncharacterized protein AB9W97_021745 isoform 2-T2 [Spinachia spinachia]
MKTSVLLVPLCVQVLLLISAFSPADAAVLRRDDQEAASAEAALLRRDDEQQLLPDQEVLLPNGGKVKQEERPRRPGCWRRFGSCSVFGKKED